MFCPNCGNSIEAGAQFCPHCGTIIAPAQQPQQPAYPMKWFKFLIYFALWLGAVLNIISGVLNIASASLVPRLTVFYYICGIAAVAIGVFGIYTRYRLAGYYKDGPTMLTYLYAAGLALTIFNAAGIYILIPEYASSVVDLTSVVPSVITSIVMIFVNNTYFKKRSDLFTK